MSITNQQRSQIFRTSWRIQRSKGRTRSKALIAAWAIFQNEDIMIYQLTRKRRTANRSAPAPQYLTLFN